MDANLVQVNWETRKKVLFSNLNTLRKKQIHTDIILSCDGESFPAHRLVLSMSSGYFAKAFQKNKEKYPGPPYLVLICGIKASILHSILNFIYDGTATINSDDIPELLKAGLTLEIPGLMEMGKNYTDNTFQELKVPNDPYLTLSQNFNGTTKNGASGYLNGGSHLFHQPLPQNSSENCNYFQPRSDVKNILEKELVQLSSDTDPESNTLSTKNLMGETSGSEIEQDFEGWESQKESSKPSTTKGSTKGCKRNQVCPTCSKSFFKKESLLLHIEAHKKAEPVTCKFCFKTYKTVKLCRSHMKEAHDKIAVITNGKNHVGDKKIGKRKRFRSHTPLRSKHHTKETVDGILCSVAQSFKRDMHFSHSFEDGIYNHPERQNAHPSTNSTANGIDGMEYLKYSVVSFRNKACSLCEREFPNSQSYRHHRATDCKVLECEFCLSSFILKEESSYQRHFESHMNSSSPYTCPICKFKTDKKCEFEDHISVHSGVYRFRCPLCNYQAGKMIEIRSHSEKFHPEVNASSIDELACQG